MEYTTFSKEVATKRRSAATFDVPKVRPPQSSKYVFLDTLLLNSIYIQAVFVYQSTLTLWSVLGLLLLINLSWFVATRMHNTYPHWGMRSVVTMTRVTVIAVLTHVGLVTIGLSLLPLTVLPIAALAPVVVGLLTTMVGLRFVGQWWIKKNIAPFDYVIVGGKTSNIEAIQQSYQQAYAGKANCVGRFGNRDIKHVRHIGRYNEIFDYIKQRHSVHRVVYIYSKMANQDVQRLMQLCASRFIDFMVIPREADLFNKGISIEACYDLPVFMPRQNRISYLHNRFIKRLFDVLFSLLMIVFILSWLVPLIAILIKLESKGPVFFLQKRTGYFNQQFNCIKFRSMEVNDIADDQQAYKGDPRITRIGAILRKTSIDEFPQFFNVLLGQMSVVGPRPHPLKQTAQYSAIINEFMIRHRVKPGVTGWAQVNGYRGPTETIRKMRLRVKYDIWYIDNWRFWLDLKCVFMTVVNFFKGDANAF